MISKIKLQSQYPILVIMLTCLSGCIREEVPVEQSEGIIYSGDSLNNIAFPVGGIGTGDILIGGRGNILSLEIFNRAAMTGNLPYMTFFALWCKQGNESPVARILEGELPDNAPGPYGLQRNQLAGLPRFENAAFSGRFPFGNIQLTDNDVPLRIRGEFFNPLVPLDVDNSSLPTAGFYWTLENPTDDTVVVSLDFNLGNPLRQKGNNERSTHLGNTNSYYESGKLRGVMMSNREIPESDLFGNLILATSYPDLDIQTAWYEGAWWDDATLYWEDFAEDGILEPRHEEVTWKGSDWYGFGNQTIVASVNAKVDLAPGETLTIPFYLSWYVPNRVLETSLAFGNEEVENTKLRNYYAVRFKSAEDALLYYISKEEELLRYSRQFADDLFDSALPEYAIDAISANTAILKTNLLMRTSEGWIHGFEGLGDQSGCCPGNCTHVWNYAQTMAALFPSLERNAREISFNHDTFKNGYQCFRSVFPLGDYWFKNAAADGQMGSIIRVYREWKYSGDSEWLKKLWPNVKLALEFAWKGSGQVTGKYNWQNHALVPWDPAKEGVMRGDQHNTYDINFFGPNMMTGSLYLAALKACSEMAAHMGENDKSAEYLELYTEGLEKYKELVWNGNYFTQKIEIYEGIEIPDHLKSPPDESGRIIPKYQLGDGCLSDQLLGQFLAHNAGLGFIVDRDMVHQAMNSVYKHNFIRDLSAFPNVQRVFGLNRESGLVIASWPSGNRPKIPFVYSDEVWTGIEYGAAVNMINAGLVKEGLEVVEAVRNRYRGYNRNPWGEIESGMFYARAMASWGLLNALSGFVYDGISHSIQFDPKLNAADFKSFWSCGSGWGTVSRNQNEVILKLNYGELLLSEFSVPKPEIRQAFLNNVNLGIEYQDETLRFKEIIRLKEGDVLRLVGD